MPKQSVALDFANTAGFHAIGDRTETLRSYADLLAWSASAGLLTPSVRRQLEKGEAFEPRGAEGALRSAIELRDALQAIFSRVARRRPVSSDALETLNRHLSSGAPERRIAVSGQSILSVWRKSDSADQMLRSIVTDAADLLTSPELGRLRECSGRDCSRFFLDTSRNGTRRWCSMAGCGNRAKARRHYRKSKERPRKP